jgi:hypothetical protein
LDRDGSGTRGEEDGGGEEEDKEEERKFVRDSKVSKKPETCPKCGSKKITLCPGGSSLKLVPGIW